MEVLAILHLHRRTSPAIVKISSMKNRFHSPPASRSGRSIRSKLLTPLLAITGVLLFLEIQIPIQQGAITIGRLTVEFSRAAIRQELFGDVTVSVLFVLLLMSALCVTIVVVISRVLRPLKALVSLRDDFTLGQPPRFSLHLVDIDDFKLINDTFGYRAADTIEDLMRNADTALLTVKATGKGASKEFSPERGDRLRRATRLERPLRSALENHEFGVIPPSDFIPLAEKTGLIAPLGLGVLDQAYEFLGELEARGHRGLQIFVNVSPVQILDDGFLDRIKDAVSKGRNPGSIILEITESQDQWNFIQACGCHKIQDCFLSRPLRAAHAIEFMTSFSLAEQGPP